MRQASFFLPLLMLLSFVSAGQDSIPRKSLEALQFRSIGPAGMSGRITAIAVDPRDQRRIYAGSASGGLWRSENGGTTWQCLFNNEAVSSIGAIALHPHNPDHLYVGTGEGNPRNSATAGAGLYRSIDGGKNWECLGLEETRYIHRILIHPRDPSVLYVAAPGNMWADSPHRGVYKSQDGGETWEQILYLDQRTGAAEMVMDPQNPEKLLVNMWSHRREPWFFQSGGKTGGLYISFDGGKQWQKRGEKAGLPAVTGRMGLAIAASQSQRVYALVEKEGKNAFFRSDDGGLNWQKVSEDAKAGNRPFYYAEIYVDPRNENRVYSLWSVLSRSEDAGKNWEIIADYSAIHPDHHAFYIHPQNPDYIIEGNDGGLNISQDRGATWRFVENLPLAQFYHLDYDTLLPYSLYGGMQDNGSWKGPAYAWRNDGLRNDYWEELYFGDGFRVLPDRRNPRYVYAMSQEGYLSRVDSETGHRRMIRPVHPEGEALRYNWNAPLALDYFADSCLYFGAQYLFRSRDAGQNWELISPDLTSNDSSKQNYFESGGLTYDVTGAENYTTLLCVEPSSREADLLWTGSDDGKLHLSRDGGVSWQDLSDKLTGLAKGAWLPQIRHSLHQDGAAFVVANDYRRGNWEPYLYYTDNYGRSFRRLVKPKQVEGYVLSVVQDRENPDLLFLGTQRGLYFSWDFGKHWQKWGTDFPTVPVTALKIHPREDDLIAGTFGRSALVLDDLAPLRQAIASAKNQSEAWLAPIETAYQVAYKRADGSRFPASTAFKGENRAYGARIYYHLPAQAEEDSSKAKKLLLLVQNAAGDSIYQHWAAYEEGLQSWNWNLRKQSPYFPRKASKLGDTTRSAWVAVIPGEYRVSLVLQGKTKAQQALKVKSDPRVALPQEAWAAYALFGDSLENSLRELREAAEHLRYSKEMGQLFKDQLLPMALKMESMPREEAKVLSDSLGSYLKSLKKLEEALYGKEVDGYYQQPETLAEQFGMMRGYWSASWDAPSRDTWRLFRQYQTTQKAWLDKLSQFYEELNRDNELKEILVPPSRLN